MHREHAGDSGCGANCVGRSAHVGQNSPGRPGSRSRPPMKLSRRSGLSVPSVEAVLPRSLPDRGGASACSTGRAWTLSRASMRNGGSARCGTPRTTRSRAGPPQAGRPPGRPWTGPLAQAPVSLSGVAHSVRVAVSTSAEDTWPAAEPGYGEPVPSGCPGVPPAPDTVPSALARSSGWTRVRSDSPAPWDLENGSLKEAGSDRSRNRTVRTAGRPPQARQARQACRGGRIR